MNWECRLVQEALPDYVAGRGYEPPGEIALHLRTCEDCGRVRQEIEAVFALLSALPEEPLSAHAEANAKLALRSAFAPGPLRSLEENRRRETIRLAVSAVISLLGFASAGLSLFLLTQKDAPFHSAFQQATALSIGSFTPLYGIPWRQGPLLWLGLGLFFLAGGVASLIPAFKLKPSSHRKRARREA